MNHRALSLRNAGFAAVAVLATSFTAQCAANDAWCGKGTPKWSLTLERDGLKNPLHVDSSGQSWRVEKGAGGSVRYICDKLMLGTNAWRVSVVCESRSVSGGIEWTGSIANNDSGVRVTAFRGPWSGRQSVDPAAVSFCVAEGFGRRISVFPSVESLSSVPKPGPLFNGSRWSKVGDGQAMFNSIMYPGPWMSMPWISLDSGSGTFYAGIHDAAARPRGVSLDWFAKEHDVRVFFRHQLSLRAGGVWRIPNTVFARERGDWHDSAKRYRAWYDSVHKVRAVAQDWARDITGWLLVIMKQQNEELMWPYTDLPKLCDVAERNGLNCIGLFGWTVGGHDHLYPDYDPDPKMGGVEALKAGIAEAHRRGIRVCIYANGQLQQIGATKFWDEHGKRLALSKRDGSLVVQTYHKYKDIPVYQFALGCLCGDAWYDRMLFLAQQASSFGADAILYDQLGMYPPFECWGKDHGHPVPWYTYGEERPGFIRNIANAMRARDPNFAVFTEGLHDTILDSISFFHACQYGAREDSAAMVMLRAAYAAGKGKKPESFPEMWRYTFPELVTTTRIPTPMVHRSMVNYAAVFGFRHEIELRYAADRTYILEGKVPERKDYGEVTGLPSLPNMKSTPPAVAGAYLKAVCAFQKENSKYLHRGRFVDDEGFTCPGDGLVAKRFLADDGTSAVCVWNISGKPIDVEISGLGDAKSVFAPNGEKTDGPLAADSIRLYVFGK